MRPRNSWPESVRNESLRDYHRAVATTMLTDRYELGAQLGHGGMATVYEAHDHLLDRAVAVKLLRVFDQANARERFAAEARNAAKLTHPHAVAVYDVSVTTDRPFIVMELVRGDTLEDVLERDGSLDARAVVAVGCQVLSALHAAHGRGLVHRDVKPANILLPDGRIPATPEELPGVKLADFGIAKAMHDATVGLTMAGQVIGTPKYLSPEQVKGERATPLSDVYSTSVVLYEMLAGRPPFERDSAVGLALAHREDDPPPLRGLQPDLDPALAAVIHRGMAKEPDARPADADEMRLALLRTAGAPTGTALLPDADAETQLAQRPAPARAPDAVPSEVVTQPPRQAPRGRRLLWAVVLGVLLALAGLFLAQQLSAPAPADEPGVQEQAPQGDADTQPDTQPDAGGQAVPDAGATAQPDPTAPAEPAPDQPEPEPEPEPTG